MARHGINKAGSVIRLLEGRQYVGRHITYSRNQAYAMVAEIQASGVMSRLITLPESEHGLANRYVVGVERDDEMSPEALLMWKMYAESHGLPLLEEIGNAEQDGQVLDEEERRKLESELSPDSGEEAEVVEEKPKASNKNNKSGKK